MDDDFKTIRKQTFKSNTACVWKSISSKAKTIFDKHKDTEPKWYILKIDCLREKSILKQIQELINSGIILEYKKLSELSNNAVVKYKLLFIKMVMNNKSINATRKIQHTYGFYLSNKNIITISNLEDYLKNAINTNEKLQEKSVQEKNYSVTNNSDALVTGQYVTINKGFFAGSKGRVVSINNDIVSVEVDFYYNTVITTEVDISSIVVNS